MANWLNRKDSTQWDDGDKFKPGEEGFSRAKAEAHFGHKDFDYIGTPNWAPPAPPADAPAA